MKTNMKLIFAAIFFMVISCKDAQEPNVFSENGKALKGFDPVAFFKDHEPVPGKDAYKYSYNDALWFFSSEENLNDFKNEPEKYEPQYGGYCAFGMSKGYKAPVEIETWSIKDEKLYFNYNKDVQKDWIKNQEDLIKRANRNWAEKYSK